MTTKAPPPQTLTREACLKSLTDLKMKLTMMKRQLQGVRKDLEKRRDLQTAANEDITELTKMAGKGRESLMTRQKKREEKKKENKDDKKKDDGDDTVKKEDEGEVL